MSKQQLTKELLTELDTLHIGATQRLHLLLCALELMPAEFIFLYDWNVGLPEVEKVIESLGLHSKALEDKYIHEYETAKIVIAVSKDKALAEKLAQVDMTKGLFRNEAYNEITKGKAFPEFLKNPTTAQELASQLPLTVAELK